MKKSRCVFIGALLFIFCLFGSSSCTLFGALIGGDHEENTLENPTEVIHYDGWKEPQKKKSNVNVTLINESMIYGRLIGTKIYEAETESIEYVLISDDARIHKIPVKDIIATDIYPPGKFKSSKKGAYIGLAIDVAIVVAGIIIMNNSDWNIWSGPI